MKKQTGNAQVADTSTPSPKSEPSIQIPPKALKLAKQVGIDLEPIVKWGMQTEVRLQRLEQGIQTLGVRLGPLIKLAERAEKMQEKGTSQSGPPTGGGLNLGSLMQVLPALLGGGTSESSLQKEFVEKAVQKAMVGMDLSNAFMRAMIVKIAPELADSVTKDLTKKE